MSIYKTVNAAKLSKSYFVYSRYSDTFLYHGNMKTIYYESEENSLFAYITYIKYLPGKNNYAIYQEIESKFIFTRTSPPILQHANHYNIEYYKYVPIELDSETLSDFLKTCYKIERKCQKIKKEAFKNIFRADYTPDNIDENDIY